MSNREGGTAIRPYSGQDEVCAKAVSIECVCIQVKKNQLKILEGFEAGSFPAFQVNVTVIHPPGVSAPLKPRGRVWPGLKSVGGDFQPQQVTVLTPATQRRCPAFYK